ncbi:hypothetical protein A2635_03135 [Candidatus Peribacteria bacterium RIFCSPHIGHO2_01_FULL_51_9]|nr:MAG: hypothetical protein A2635_03135 [Candidatus Peribacteria bacterium RIFCSPHIGHO2_01_FULL_51_9]
MIFFRPSGPAYDLALSLQQSPVARRARWDFRWRRGRTVRRLVLGLGQMHPVLHGRFDFFLARRIALVQAWIFDVLRHLLLEYGVHSFGQEGFSADVSGVTRARVNAPILEELKAELRDHHSAKLFLKRVAQHWRRALRRGSRSQTEYAATALNALTLLQALHAQVTVFPLEQSDVHGRVYEGIVHLQNEIARIESSSAFCAMQRKGGKKLTSEEYAAATLRNKLVKEFNALLAHPERDRSIMRQVIEHIDGPLTVFILGNAHRRNILKIAREHVPDDALFVWITPPALWWWEAVMRRMGWGLALGICFLGFTLWW